MTVSRAMSGGSPAAPVKSDEVLALEAHHHYDGTIRLRRDGVWKVKPEAEAMDGRSVRVQAGWVIEPDDSESYAGEWAMIVNAIDSRPGEPVWIASGDITNLQPSVDHD